MSENWSWKEENKSRHSAGDAFVLRRPGGWGQRFNAYCQREWAANLNGEYLRNAKGHIRQFATSTAAKRAAEAADLDRAMIDRTTSVMDAAFS